MAVALERWRFTVDEFEQMVKAGILHEDDRVELIHGEVVRMSPIGPRHVAAVNRCVTALAGFVARRSAILSVQNPIRLGDHSQPQPDVTLLRWRDDSYEDRLPGPGDVVLVIEVADSSRAFDRDVKLPLYAASGISECWLVDLEGGYLESHREPRPDGYALIRRYHRGERIAAAELTGLELPIEEILGPAR